MSDDPSTLQFVDTNILVYAHDLSAGRKREIARKLVDQCWHDQNGCLSVQVLQEFYVTVTQKINKPLDRITARQMIADFSYWSIHVPASSDVLHAIDLQTEYSLSFWDSMIIHSALQLGCQKLWSEDLTHEQVYRSAKVINPFIE